MLLGVDLAIVEWLIVIACRAMKANGVFNVTL